MSERGAPSPKARRSKYKPDAPYGWFCCPFSGWKHAEVTLGPDGRKIETTVLIAKPIRRGRKQFYMFCGCTGRVYLPVDWQSSWGETEDEVLARGARLVYS